MIHSTQKHLCYKDHVLLKTWIHSTSRPRKKEKGKLVKKPCTKNTEFDHDKLGMKASFEIYIFLLQKEEKQESRKLQLRNPKIRSQHLLPELLDGHKVSTGTKEYNQPAVQFETKRFIPSSTFLLHYHCLNLSQLSASLLFLRSC